MAERIHIDTAAKRARLPHRRNRYWQGVSGGRGGVSLGYRKARFGPGSWIGKIVISGARIEERLAPADDGAALAGALDYAKAVSSVLEWARQKYAAIEERADVANQGSEPTIQSAVVAYISRRKRQSKHGTDASSPLTKHVIENERFAAKRLNKIKRTELPGGARNFLAA